MAYEKLKKEFLNVKSKKGVMLCLTFRKFIFFYIPSFSGSIRSKRINRIKIKAIIPFIL
jgi:hypothetical protein